MSLNPIIESVIDDISIGDIKLTLDEAFQEVMSKYDSTYKEPIKKPGIVAKRAPEVTPPPNPAVDEQTRDAAESLTYLDLLQASADGQTVSVEPNQASGRCPAAAEDGQPPKKMRKVGGTGSKVCYAPICPCSSFTCTIQTTSGTSGQKYDYWKRFLKLYDPSADVEQICARRKDRRIYLCCCHFDDEDNLVIPPVLTKTMKELKKKDDEMDKLNRALNEIMTKDQIERLVTHFGLKRKRTNTGEGVNEGVDEDVNECINEGAESKRIKLNGRKFSQESLLKCLEMYEKLGGARYRYLISLNWPLASKRSVLRFKSQFKNAIADDTRNCE